MNGTMAERKPFLLRLDPDLHEALARLAADEVRSLNGEIEFLLREALAARGRLPKKARPAGADRDDRGARQR